MTKKLKVAKAIQGPNGSIIHKVRAVRGPFKGQMLTFTQHSEDRYTVFGMAVHPQEGLSIERRTPYQDYVHMSSSGACLTLQENDQWIAYEYNYNGYYGALAVGATAQEAYEKTFNRFNT